MSAFIYFSLIATTLFSVLPAQEKADPKKRSETARQNGRVAVQLWRVEVMRQGVLQQKIVRRRMQIGPGRSVPRTQPIVVLNPLLTGTYKKAIDSFDLIRAKLYTTKDPRHARQSLDQLDRALLDVRSELWKLEKAAKRKWVAIPTLALQPSSWNRVFKGPLRSGANSVVLVGNQLVMSARANPLLRGDYEQGIDALRKTRAKLEFEQNPKIARAHVDQMMRDVLAVRAALWLSEQATKDPR